MTKRGLVSQWPSVSRGVGVLILTLGQSGCLPPPDSGAGDSTEQSVGAEQVPQDERAYEAPRSAASSGLDLSQELAYSEGRVAAESARAEAAAARAEAAEPEPPEPLDTPPADAQRTKSGLVTQVLEAGQGGARPSPSARVTCHYTGWTTDGERFDSTRGRGQPASFDVAQVVPGFAEAIQMMTKGERRLLWIPEALAYGGRPGTPQGMLVFDVALLDFEERRAVPDAPADVDEPPADADRTASGLFSKVLREGTGAKHPRASDTVRVHYTGWTTDGAMFDSSISRGEPAVFPLRGVIAGWTEGLQLMVVGEVRRFWIPERLAYKGRPGSPQGMLVFDVELLGIE